MRPKPKATKKRQRSKKAPPPAREQVPDAQRDKMQQVVRSITIRKDESRTIAEIQTVFCDELQLPHISDDIIRRCLQSNDTDENIKRDLEKLGQQKWIQTSKAERAFALLDEGQKEFVVVQDLQRVATDLLQDATVDDLHEMVQEFDQSGDGILTKDDLIRIARKVGL